MSLRTRRFSALALAAAVVGFVAIVVLSSGNGAGGGELPNDADGAFITGMVAHHKGALDMAVIAGDKAEHAEVKQLAERIVAEQNAEIDELNAAHRRIYGEPVPAGGMQHGGSAEGMATDSDLNGLGSARPFDRAFIDLMVRHHQGAVRMAQTELDRGGDAETRRLAEKIIKTQSQEIDQMLAWRSSWYGRS